MWKVKKEGRDREIGVMCVWAESWIEACLVKEEKKRGLNGCPLAVVVVVAGPCTAADERETKVGRIESRRQWQLKKRTRDKKENNTAMVQ